MDEQVRADRVSEQHPTTGLDDVVHQRHRLGILTIAAEAERVEFGYLRSTLDLTAGNLSRHITVLEESGLVQVDKGYDGRRPKTWVRITGVGRTALTNEMAALRALLTRHEESPAG
ncbi:transcriptional regulator [Actinosynnema sp. NPDC047251]|uniref:transcriptional regulator n=1 Tax=Saccharothrix espanaensis TaxID=103731 RepID=UPI0002FB280E|nr:transcriptional regulator [Saccharothrix espanaensis]